MSRLRTYLPSLALGLGVLLGVAALSVLIVFGDPLDVRVLAPAAAGLALIAYGLLDRPDNLRRAIVSREAQHGTNTIVMTLAFLGLVIGLNILTNRFSHRWDLTETKAFSISPQTINVLQTINSPVRVLAFYQPGQGGLEELEDLLKEYQRHTTQITYQIIDPIQMPGLAREYRVETFGTTILESEGRRQNMTGANEADLTSALVKLQRGTPKRIIWVTGHGELDIDSFDQGGASELKRQIELENYSIRALSLLTAADVPADTSVVVLARPRQPLLPQEIAALSRYLVADGKLLVMLEPRSPGNSPELLGLLGTWGIQVDDGVVVDLELNLQGDPFSPAVIRYSPNPIMRTVGIDQTGRYITVFPGSLLVAPRAERDPALVVQTIAQTSPDRSWLESDRPVNPATMRFDAGVDTNGPISLAVTSMRSRPPQGDGHPQDRSTRIVAIGNGSFATNAFLSFMLISGNRDLAVNSVNWLAEEESLISVRARPVTDRSLILSGPQQNTLLFISTLFLPAGLLLIGGIVWWTRR
ncbi:MAG: hypothetical protein FJ033_03835 [Chloroflexi bacterium]|nr:hypothetical protein [Chloroflexota bacterium]